MADEISLELIGRILIEMQGDMRALKSSVVALDTRVAALDTRVAALDTRVAALEIRVNAVQLELRYVKDEMREMRTAISGVIDQSARHGHALERGFREQRENLELLLKSEMFSRAGHFETRYERRIEAVEDRLALLEGSPPPN